MTHSELYERIAALGLEFSDRFTGYVSTTTDQAVSASRLVVDFYLSLGPNPLLCWFGHSCYHEMEPIHAELRRRGLRVLMVDSCNAFVCTNPELLGGYDYRDVTDYALADAPPDV